MALAKAGEVELDYQRGGNGPPLLMIMGLGGTYAHWDERFLEDLKRDHEVIIYDHRGVGKSTRVSEPFTIAQLAQDASALLGALEIGNAHVLGFSMGGMVAQELALSHPEQTDRLVLASTYCGGAESKRSRSTALSRLAEAGASGDRELATQVAWEINVSPEFAQNEQARERFFEIASRRRVAFVVLRAQVNAIMAHDTSERLPSLTLPTLVIHGTADEMVPVENGRLIASLVPDSRLEILDGAGHLFFWEVPKHAAQLVRSHIGGGERDLALGHADSA